MTQGSSADRASTQQQQQQRVPPVRRAYERLPNESVSVGNGGALGLGMSSSRETEQHATTAVLAEQIGQRKEDQTVEPPAATSARGTKVAEERVEREVGGIRSPPHGVPPLAQALMVDLSGDRSRRSSSSNSVSTPEVQPLPPLSPCFAMTAVGPDRPPDTPNYYDWKELFPELEALVHGLPEILEECSQVAAWKAWPEKHYEEGGEQDWKVFPFVHTFPACDESRRTWIESTCARCPATTQILERLPNIRTALFSRLGGGSRISGHKGWADLANHVLRCHLPLKVPTDGPCGLWVNGEVQHHREGEIVVFDDSKLHKAFNESTGDRLVLIVDMVRPKGVAPGTAEGGHTPELDSFIDAFR